MPDSNLSTPTPDTGAGADPTLPGHPVGNVLDILQHSARELGATANELAEQPPTIALFSAVEKLTADILRLREPALDAAAQETIDALLADLATYLSEKSKTATWLVAKVDSIMAEWRSTYPLQGGNLPDELRASIRRAQRSFDRQLEKCAVLYARERDAKDALDLHDSAMDAKGVPSRADLELLDRRSDDHSAARKAVFVARRDAIDALAPTSSALPATSQPTGVPIDTATPVAPPETAHVSAGPSHAALPDSLNEAGGDSSRQTLSAAPPENEVRDSDRDGPSGGPSTAPPDSRDHSPQPVPTAEPASVAESAQDTPPEETSHYDALRPAQAAVWDAVGSGRLGLAYQIALADQAVEGRVAQPSPELLAAVALGTVVCGPDDDVAHEFGRRIGDLTGCLDFGNVDQSTGDALNLLLFAASLFPALFASQLGGIPLLRRVELSDGLTPLFRLAGAVAKYAEKLQTIRLDLPTLTGILDEDAWKDRFARHADEVARWRSSTTFAKFLYAPAGAVWKHWLRDGGILAKLDHLLSTDEAAHEERVRQIVDQLADKRSVNDLIKNTDRKEIGRSGQGITGRALSQFQSRLAEPLALAQAWLHLMEAKPGGAGYVHGIVEQLHSDINDHVPVARDAIQKLQRASPTVPLASALCCALDAVESLDAIFRRKREGGGNVAIGSVQALSDDLLFVPGLHVDSRGTIPASIPPADVLARLIDADAHAETLLDAFDLRLGQNDLLGAHAVCTRMTAEDDPAEDACQGRLNHAVALSRDDLQRRLYDVTDKLEQAFINGQISEDLRADLTASIAETTRLVENRDQALTAASDVTAIEAQIEPRFANAIVKVKAQLDEYLPLSDSREQALVQHALDVGDLTILHEQIDCLESDQPLRSPDARGLSRLRSLLEIVDQIADELEGTAGPSHDALVRAAADREDILGLKFSALSAAQSKRSAELLRVWYLMARKRGADTDLVSRFFEGLGFTITDVQVRSDATVVLRTEPLRARELCPVHSFGSDARGRYEVVLNWNASSREPIIQMVGSAPHERKFVLHFGKLARADREWLRWWSIQNSVQFLTVDETLVLYLASLPDGALRALFDCTLPFTCAEPFFTAAGLVPPESFFGRESERSTITERFGSCFVYGGRQLGKTALLNAAQAAFHNPASGHLAPFVDLKVHGIGKGHDADHIWHVLWDLFVQLGVIEPEQQMPRGHDSLVSAIAKTVTGWLDREDQGDILLLLDEADDFLASDLKNDFRVSTRLKGLMDKTQRRFKVVLCGLHNVLRNTDRANHPLAHFGEPVCVGPLLGNGDLQQARALIRDPMAAVGYTFETENLLTKILVWTNYYPSLIQLYGEALLRYLRQTPGRKVPYTITSEDIQAVFNRDQFRDYIRDRFSLTLRLDERYEVIAYAMAYHLLQNEPDRLSGELLSTEIREYAEEAWPEGFEIPDKEFDTLLREMCGLGVLRQRPASSGRSSYVFRNPNVLLLLGDTDNILEVLWKDDREIPPLFEASAFHAQYPRGKPQSPRRSPLTWEQEALLKRGGRIAVLSETRAADHGSVKEFLCQSMDERHLRQLDAAVTDKAFRKKLTGLRHPDRGTITIALVHDEDQWNMRWIEEASNALKKIQRGKALRVVFFADPDQLWNFVSYLPDEYLCEANGLFDWVAVQPWTTPFLRQWCSDQNLHEATTKIDELLNTTGGWPLLLERYAESDKKNWNAKASELEDYVAKHREDLLDALGLGSTMVRSQLAPMGEMGPLTQGDFEAYVELVDQNLQAFTLDDLRRRIWWATQLGLVQEDHGSVSLNPLVARILADDTP